MIKALIYTMFVIMLVFILFIILLPIDNDCECEDDKCCYIHHGDSRKSFQAFHYYVDDCPYRKKGTFQKLKYRVYFRPGVYIHVYDSIDNIRKDFGRYATSIEREY